MGLRDSHMIGKVVFAFSCWSAGRWETVGGGGGGRMYWLEKTKAHLLKGEQPAAAHLYTLNLYGSLEFTKSFHTYTVIFKRRMG